MARSVYYFTDSPGRGGAEAALLLLIEHLDKEAWRPTLLYNDAPEVRPVAAAARELGATVRAVPPLPLGPRGLSRLPLLVRTLRRERPAVFHAHLIWPLAAAYPLAAACAARVPGVVATFQLFPPMTFKRRSLVEQRLLGARVGRAIAVSDAIAAQVRGTLGWPGDRIVVIRNGVPVERLRRPRDPELRRALSGGSDDVVFLTTARLDPQKGIPFLLRAAQAVAGARFAIAGSGPERHRLERAVAGLGIGDRVLFLGHRDDVPALLAASDAFVLPSLFEGTPLAILEAMAAGLPVVASRIDGIDELIVDGEDGLLVPSGEPDRLADALRRVVAEPDLRARLGDAARDRVASEFSAAATAARVSRVYEDLLR